MERRGCATAASLLIGLSFAMAAEAQVYKCPDSSGKLSLQQTPCQGGTRLVVRPAAGHDPEQASQESAAADGSAVPPKKRSYTDQLVDERLQRERWLRLNDARLAVDRERALCEKEQQELAASKQASRNNLAGATRDVAISGEMKASATMCIGRLGGLEAEVNRRLAECERLGCRQPGT